MTFELKQDVKEKEFFRNRLKELGFDERFSVNTDFDLYCLKRLVYGAYRK